MFSIARKVGFIQAAKSVSLTERLTAAKFISTSENAKHSEMMGKRENETVPVNLGQKLKLRKISRALSTVNHSVPIAARATVSIDESRDFMAVFPDVVRDLTEYANKYDSKHASKWLAKVLQYNVPKGKKNRGLVTVLTFKQLVDKEHWTPENVKLAQILGWCVEMLQSVLIIADDIMDDSVTRRGQTCWHKVEDVGMRSINDILTVQSGIFYILNKYFSGTDYYVKLLEVFHQVLFITTLGQSLDMQTANKCVTSFTMDKYKTIVTNKTAYYTFYLPVALAMHMAGYTDHEIFRQARTILLEMGHFFQVQDDFLDCFGDPAVTGKVGTDIQDNKCSWLAVVGLQRASDEQKEIMKECYGSKDLKKVETIKELYKELGLPSTYAIYEEESYNMIKTHIQQTSRGVPHEIFFKIMDKIYQRDS